MSMSKEEYKEMVNSFNELHLDIRGLREVTWRLEDDIRKLQREIDTLKGECKDAVPSSDNTCPVNTISAD